MAGLYYTGKTPAVDRDLVIQADAKTTFNTGVTHDYVINQIDSKIATKVTKSQVDAWDSVYAPVNYYQDQDKLLLPLTAKGTAGGVATLGTSTALSKSGTTTYVVNTAQLPVLGAGMMRGPYGMNKQYSKGNIGSTPSLIGEWLYSTDGTNFVMPFTGYFLPFLTVAAQNTGGRTVLEVRAGKTSKYAEQALIATGCGRTWFDGYQIINIVPAASGNPATLADTLVFDATTKVYVSLWMFNESGGRSSLMVGADPGDGSSNVTAGMVYTSALYVCRTEQ